MKVLNKEVVMGELYTILETTEGTVKAYPSGKVDQYDETLNIWTMVPDSSLFVTELREQGVLRKKVQD